MPIGSTVKNGARLFRVGILPKSLWQVLKLSQIPSSFMAAPAPDLGASASNRMRNAQVKCLPKEAEDDSNCCRALWTC